MTETKTVSTAPSQEEKMWAAVGYLWILSLVVLASRKKNDYIRFHANQGVFLFVASIVFMLTGPFIIILNLIVGVAAVVGIIKAIQGEKWELPAVGGLAQKLGDWIIKTLKL
ncbi:MAG: hypothetical protein A2744_01450 [Candidatus Buchananbacteria bacterium RIFCSPHIGHO2_01_FULL_44_11]|nr:MAG: hypothetical protein A2744_01450 [Candidatus Buchananbacteria bacterium RIFCSPHIGHO2_01_FULL_44_11]